MNAVIQTRVSPKLKREAEALFVALGVSMPDAIRMFLQQSVHESGLPFRPRLHGLTLSNEDELDGYLDACEREMKREGAVSATADRWISSTKRRKK